MVFAEELSNVTRDKMKEILSCDVKVVSFDMFDTLMLRPVTNPEDVWTLVGKIANVPNFRQKRRAAANESMRYVEYPAEDRPIEKVYDTYARMFGCSKEEANRIMQIEMDVEYDLLYPRRTLKRIYNEALIAGKEIIITSDMYLPSEFLDKILKKNGYTGYSRIYVSGKEGLTKGSGNLYHRIVNDFRKQGIRADEIIQVGDNYRSDFTNPQKANMKAVFIKRTIDAFNHRPVLKSYNNLSHLWMDNPFLLGIMANMMFDDPYILYSDSRYNGNPYFLGLNIAPFMVSFLLWMAREAKKDGIEQLAFMYRDGWLPEKMYEIMKPFLPKFETTKLYLSRAVRRVHFAKQKGGLYDSLLNTSYDPTMSVKDFIVQRLLVTNKEDSSEVKEVFIRHGYFSPDEPIGDVSRYVHFLFELEPYFMKNAREGIELCDEYIAGKIDATKKLGIFDVGYRGSSSKFLESQYGMTHTGYYMLSRPTMDLNNFNLGQTQLKTFIMYGVHQMNRNSAGRDVMLHFLLEDILCEHLPGVSKLIRTENGVEPLQNEPFLHSENVSEIQRGILEFTQLLTDLFGIYMPFLEFDRFGFFEILLDIFESPIRKDAELLRNMDFYDSGFVKNTAESVYGKWFNLKFPAAPAKPPAKPLAKPAPPPEKRTFKRRILDFCYRTAKKLGVFRPAQKVYRFLAGKPQIKYLPPVAPVQPDMPAKPMPPKPMPPPTIAAEVRAQVDSAINALEGNTYLERDNNLVFIGDIHPSAYKILNSLSASMPSYRWLYLTANSNRQRKLTFPTYPVPQAFARGHIPPDTRIKQDAETKERLSASEDLRVAAKRLQKTFPSLEAGYAEFLVCELERYYEHVFTYLKPKLICLWNQYVAQCVVANAVARRYGIPVAYLESSVLSGIYSLGSEGLLGESWVAREPEKFLSLPVSGEELAAAGQLINYLYETDANRYLQKATDAFLSAIKRIDKSRPTIFLAGDTDAESGAYPITDYSKSFCSPMFETSRDAMLHIAKIAQDNNWNLIYKPHPISVGFKSEPFEHPSNVIFIEEGDFNELIDTVDLVIGVIGSATYTALIRGKPALVIGYTPIKGKGCAYEAYDFDEIEPTIKLALKQGYTDGQRQAFVKHIAQMNKYYLFDNMADRPFRYGRSIEEAVQFLQNMIDK